MTKREMTKKIVGSVVGYGSGVIVYAIIRNNVPADIRIDRKISAAAASFVLGGLVAERAERYSNRIIDDFFNQFDKAKKSLQK